MIASLADVPGVPRVGDIVAGKYRVESLIGQGGMGVVVSARHLALGQLVAVKFLLPSAVTQPSAIDRFLREARAAVAIQSEHVARVIDIGTLQNGMPYLVMEHLVGTDLRRVLARKEAFSVPETVEYVLQVSEAIAEAHALGIIHRDLKPANIFVTHRLDGSPFLKVLDFGLSTASHLQMYGAEELTLTTEEAVMGSPPYMSPEQIRSLKSVDTRSDIWSLGVILYRLLAGRRPFIGETLPAICASIAADTPQPLSAIRGDVPAELDAIVLRCLAKNVAERVQTVGELALGIAPFGTVEAQVSLNRIIRATPGGISTISASISTSGPVPVSSTSRSLQVPDTSAPHGNAWAQPQAASGRRARLPIAIVGIAAGAVVGIGVVSVHTMPTPAPAPLTPQVVAAPAASAEETKSPRGDPTPSMSAVAPLVALELPSEPSASPLATTAPSASSASASVSKAPADPGSLPVTRSPVRPRAGPRPAPKTADPLESWK